LRSAAAIEWQSSEAKNLTGMGTPLQPSTVSEAGARLSINMIP